MTSVAVKLDDPGEEHFADELKPGTRLLFGQFTIESFLNSGGFGITYLARDSLDRRVVVKECFPSSFCRRTDNIVGPRTRQRAEEFRSVVKLFMQEAYNLSRLDHPGIVKVHQVFEDNETAYMAMDYIDGNDLLATVEGTAPRLPPDRIVAVLGKSIEALGYVHEQGLLHRDISPDNILLDRATGNPVLIDFGAAKKDVTRKSRALSGLRVVKDGYSPQEFYIAGSMQAPCSDLYALAASFYHLITGDTPCTSQERLSAIANREPDPHLPLAGRYDEYPQAFLRTIDKAMAIFPRDRIQSAAEWLALLHDMPGEAGVPDPDAQVPGRRVPLADAVARPRHSSVPVAPEEVVATAPVGAAKAGRSNTLRLALAGVTLVLLGAVALQWGFDRLPGNDAGTPEAEVAAPLPDGMIRAVRLPFLPDPQDGTRILGVLPGSPVWMQPGQRIVEVNGQPVQDAGDLPRLLAQDVDLASHADLRVILGYEPTPGADIVRKMETLPVVAELRLADGPVFHMVNTPTGTQTVVAEVPSGVETDLQPGDVLLVYRASGETLGTVAALAAILERETDSGVATYTFAVQRGSSMIDAMFRLKGDA
jgi:hypothetical protein